MTCTHETFDIPDKKFLLEMPSNTQAAVQFGDGVCMVQVKQ